MTDAAMTAADFVEMVANMTMDGDIRTGDSEEYEMSIDDAFDTVNRLIETARNIQENA